MDDLDQKIREALQQEDTELMEDVRGEQSLREMIVESFRSRHRWLNMVMFLMPFVLVVAIPIFAYQFFQAESTRAMIGWATGFLWAIIAMGSFKILFMIELSKNAMCREVKRLELELLQVSRRLSEK